MKPMIYSSTMTREILDEGIYEGIPYYIVSLGTHPCCYVVVDKNSKFYKKQYDDIDIDVHGGLTFSRYVKDVPRVNKDKNWVKQEKKDWVLGWDYAHLHDFLGSQMIFPILMGKKYTTEELLSDVKDFIERLRKAEKESAD